MILYTFLEWESVSARKLVFLGAPKQYLQLARARLRLNFGFSVYTVPGQAVNIRRVFPNHIHPVKTYMRMNTKYVSDQNRLIIFYIFHKTFFIFDFKGPKTRIFEKKWLQNICILRGFPKTL